MNLTRAKYAAQAVSCDALNRIFTSSLNFGFNAFYSILRLCRGRADACLIDLESSLLRVLISTPVTSPSSGPVTRHSLLKWRIPVQNCLIILPLPPSASQSSHLSPIQHQTFTIFTFLADVKSSSRIWNVIQTEKYFDTHKVLRSVGNIAKSLQILISVNLDCANIVIISKRIHKMLVWSRRRPKRASPVLCVRARVSADLGSWTMGLVRTCAHPLANISHEGCEIKIPSPLWPEHEKIKLANPVLDARDREPEWI